MKKTYQIHLRIESDVTEQLKKQASTINISLAELCRKRLRDACQLERIESLLLELNERIKWIYDRSVTS